MGKHTLDQLVKEISFVLDELCYAFSYLSRTDVGVFFFSAIMILSIFLPWLCISGFITLIGLRCGGIIHIIFSLVASFEVLKVASIKRQSYDAHRLLLLPTLLKKTSLKYLFYGFSSMSISTFNLFDFLSQTKQTNLIEVRGGFYLCLLSGVGIFVCGLERFCFQNKPNSAPS